MGLSLDERSIFAMQADQYAALAQASPVNRDYDRPTMLRLAGNLDGKHVLELGCAAGGLTTHLVDRGAQVTAVDREPHMIEIARQAVGARAQFYVVDLAEPLFTVAPGSIGVVVASLVLHYIADWGPLLAELRRCLAPGGALVFSVHHPITGWLLSDRADYHRVEQVSEGWAFNGTTMTAHLYRRPIAAIFSALHDAGFAVDTVEEPRIAPGADVSEELAHQISTQPLFLFIRATAK